ncbi:hypothetical protein B0H21DRAFT_823309 [Amylocystis lapponica]|nr:hypothetical protein B0H21DRAFT_823309 [Amylocystis lapponica]
MPTTARPTNKNSLEIRLTESVVFLRLGDATGRNRSTQPDAPPGMLRGLLTLTLVKPTRISSIEIELVGKSRSAWPEGVGARRIDVTEEHEIHSQSYVLFRAGSSPFSSRRTLSVGPGIALEREDEEHSDHSSETHQDAASRPLDEEPRGRGRAPPPASLHTLTRRHQSVDQTHYQRTFVSHREDVQSPTSPSSPNYTDLAPQYTLSPSTSISHRMDTLEESPTRSIDDIPRTETEHSSTSSRISSRHASADAAHTHPAPGLSSVHERSASRLPGSSSSSLQQDSPHARRRSVDLEPEHHSPQAGSSSARRTHAREFSLDGANEDTLRGRHGKRFGFASVLLDAVRDRVRSRSPMVEHERDVTPPRGRPRERTPERDEGAHHRETALGRVGEVLGLDGDEGKEYGDGWKEFRKGVYTYPISFAIPANCPPTLHCDYGHVTWRLKAYAHRPGTFTAKLSAAQDITVVACPSEDDTEENESIIVERQWDTQMQYLITISGRRFAIGGTMPISISFMPWTKMKIHRISVLLEERVEYYSNFKRVARSEPAVRLSLLALKSAVKDGPPILPLDSDDPDAFSRSPFVDVVEPGQDVGEYASSLMGPGPWHIRTSVELPKSCAILHFTNRNRRSNIAVSHMLKVVFRVERGDDQAVDQTGKRKMFDIVVQTPVHILSCLCNIEQLALPPYSRALEPPSTSHHHAACLYLPSTVGRPDGDHPAYPSFAPGPRRPIDPLASALAAPTSPEYSVHASLPSVSGHDTIYDRSTQFERLVAGQESELGEAPPSYAAVA